MTGERKFEAITTCNATGWTEYGRRMAQAFVHYWPAQVPLHVYAEGFDALPYASRELPVWLDIFKAKHGKSKRACGKPAGGGVYNYRFDAIRFAHKTAAVIDAAERSEADVLIWIDADTVTHSQVTLDFLRELAPGTVQVISWLDRQSKYPECGFYMLNLRHEMTQVLIREWKALYLSGTLFHFAEWHDSYVLEQLVLSMKLPRKSISGAGYNHSHPFINGPLGDVMDHMKGDRKVKGHSRAKDLKIPRNEAYWKGVK